MNRRSLLMVTVLMVSCGGGSEPDVMRFPEALQADWQLGAEDSIPAESTPPLVRDLGLRQARRAFYAGPESLTIVVYEMESDTAAFELQQKWQPAEGLLTFHTGNRFVILQSPTLDHPSLAALAQTLEQHWQGR